MSKEHDEARRREFETNERAASRLRMAEIDRFDDLAAKGMLAEILDDIEPALKSCDYDREDLLRAIQEAIWPEVFLEGTLSMEGILPRGGGRQGGGYELLAQRLKYLRSKGSRNLKTLKGSPK